MKIVSITKGSGENYEFYSTNRNDAWGCDEIKQSEKIIGKGYYNDLTLVVYQIIKDSKIIAEIESNSSLTLGY